MGVGRTPERAELRVEASGLRRAWPLATLLLLGLAGLSAAGPYAEGGEERAPQELVSARARIERSAGGPELTLPLSLELPRYRARPLEADPWRLDEAPPAGLMPPRGLPGEPGDQPGE